MYVMYMSILLFDYDAWLILVSYAQVRSSFYNKINCDMFYHVMILFVGWPISSHPQSQEDAATYRAAYEEAREAGACMAAQCVAGLSPSWDIELDT